MSDQPTTPPAPDFAKLAPLPEDANRDGIVDGARFRWLFFLSVKWQLWCSDACTTFCNGFISGFGTAAVVGGASAANTDSLNPGSLSWAAAVGFLITSAANGVKHVVLWHHVNPMPNPFRP